MALWWNCVGRTSNAGKSRGGSVNLTSILECNYRLQSHLNLSIVGRIIASDGILVIVILAFGLSSCAQETSPVCNRVCWRNKRFLFVRLLLVFTVFAGWSTCTAGQSIGFSFPASLFNCLSIFLPSCLFLWLPLSVLPPLHLWPSLYSPPCLPFLLTSRWFPLTGWLNPWSARPSACPSLHPVCLCLCLTCWRYVFHLLERIVVVVCSLIWN